VDLVYRINNYSKFTKNSLISSIWYIGTLYNILKIAGSNLGFNHSWSTKKLFNTFKSFI
jgi:hypothetical protein